MQLCRIKYGFCGIYFAHWQAFVVNRAQALFGYVFAGKNEISLLVFALYVKSSVRRVEKLHDFELFFRVSVKTVHIIAAFSAFFAGAGYFVADFFAHKMRQKLVPDRFYKIPDFHVF